MKKTLIALAAVAATGAAFAQSSVTLYGVADVAVGKTNQAGLGLTNDKFQAIASNVLNNGTSRFGLRGTEDLGGGLKAGFNFEGGLSLANGAGNLSGGQLFSRAANVSLMGGFGEIRAGRSLTPSFYSTAAWELTGAANYSVVASQFGFVTAGPRDSALVMYRSPNFGGLTVDIATILKGNDASAAAGDQDKMDLGVTYKAGALTASLGYNKVSGAKANSAIGAKYDFGAFAVAGSYQDPAGVNKGFSLGVSAPMGPVTLTADVARMNSGAKNTDFLLEAKYALSKRTFAYAVYMKDGALAGGKDTNGYAIGVR
ncbi:MAG: porin, partial [Burkholderiales bacterium]|nr:porin [Burkholderiales bacterium]